MNKIKQRQTHKQREQADSFLKGRGCGMDEKKKKGGCKKKMKEGHKNGGRKVDN